MIRDVAVWGLLAIAQAAQAAQAAQTDGTGAASAPAIAETPPRDPAIDEANALFSSGKADEARAKLTAAAHEAEAAGGGDLAARRWSALASAEAGLSRFDDALAARERELLLRRASHSGDDSDVARTLNWIAFCLSELGRAGEALPRYEEALAMRERLFPGDHPAVATSLGNVAACLDSLGRSADALPVHERSLAMHRRLFPGDHPDVVLTLSNLASCLDVLGRSADSLPRHEEALAMCRRLFPGDSWDVAATLGNVASCLGDLGRFAEALPRFEEALAMCRRLFPDGHRNVALALNNVAFCLRSLGRTAEALPKFEEVLAMRRRLYPGDHPAVATSLNNVGSCLDALDRSAEALPRIEEALAMRKRLFPGDHPAVAVTLGNLGSCLDALGRSAEALPHLEESLAMRRRLFPGDHPDTARSLDNLALCLETLGRRAEALPRYEEAVAMYRRLYPSGHPHSVQTLVGAASLRAGDADAQDAVAALLSEAIEIVERTRLAARSLDPEARSRYTRELRRTDPYAPARRLEAARGRPEAAFAFAERARGRFFLDLLEGASFDPLEEAERRVHDDEAAAAAIVALRDALARVDQEDARLTNAVTRLASDTGLTADERERRRAALAPDFAKLVEERARCSAERARVIAGVVPVLEPAAPEAVRAALAPGELLLMFALDDVQSHLFVVDSRSIEATPIPASRAEVALAIDALCRSGPAASTARGKQIAPRREADAAPRSSDLFARLVPDAVWKRVRGASRVFVIPDGALHRYPLEALDVAPGRAWLDDGPPIAYAPSATVFAWLRRQRDTLRKETTALDLVALGDAKFAAVDPGAREAPDSAASAASSERQDAVSRDGGLERFGKLPSLPATRTEVEAITRSFAAADLTVRVLLGAEATEANLFRLSPEARYLHLATHGLFDEVAGRSFSAVALTLPAAATADDDGFLKLDDLLHRWRGRLASCRMVVLSACDTQVGVEQRDEAPFALSFGFVFAGTSSVVSSLWQVDDASTAELMSDFYARLAQAGATADRLAEFTAARKALKAKGASLRQWAPFVYVGSPN